MPRLVKIGTRLASCNGRLLTDANGTDCLCGPGVDPCCPGCVVPIGPDGKRTTSWALDLQGSGTVWAETFDNTVNFAGGVTDSGTHVRDAIDCLFITDQFPSVMLTRDNPNAPFLTASVWANVSLRQDTIEFSLGIDTDNPGYPGEQLAVRSFFPHDGSIPPTIVHAPVDHVDGAQTLTYSYSWSASCSAISASLTANMSNKPQDHVTNTSTFTATLSLTANANPCHDVPPSLMRAIRAQDPEVAAAIERQRRASGCRGCGDPGAEGVL